MLDKLNICSHIPCDYDFKLKNLKLKFVEEYKFMYKK